MPSKKEKEAIILVIDVAPESNRLDENGKSFLENSKECLAMIIQRKIFSKSSDEMALVVVGSEDAANPLAIQTEYNEYRHVSVLSELKVASFELLRVLEGLRCTEYRGDWLDAVIVAMNHARDEIEVKNFIRTRLVICSTLEGCVNEFDLNTIIDSMKLINAHLVFIGVDQNESNLKPSRGMNLAKYLTDEEGGVMCTFKEAMSELSNFEHKKVKPTPWNAIFHISKNIKLAISAYKMIADTAPIKFLTQSIDDPTAPVVTNQKYVKPDPTNQQTTQVSSDDVVPGVKFGGSIVPFPKEQKYAMRYKSGGKGLYLLGFTKEDYVKRAMLIGNGSYMITSRKGDTKSMKAFESLVDAMASLRRVGIAKRIYRDDSHAAIGALFPFIGENIKYMVYTELPFAEYEHVYTFPSLNRIKPGDEQLSLVDNLMDATNLDATENRDELFYPPQVFDPAAQFKMHRIAHRAMHPEAPSLQNAPDTVKQMMTLQSPEIIAARDDVIEKIKRAFPLEDNAEALKLKREAKRAKWKWKGVNIKPEGEINAAPLADPENRIGTVNPCRDFEALILLSGVSPDQAVTKMMEAVGQLVSYRSDEVEKIVEAVKLLRRKCMLWGEPTLVKIYNDWVRSLRDLRSKNLILWNCIANGKLGPIGKDEFQGSETTVEEVDYFYRAVSDSEEILPKEEPKRDIVDDLIDEL